MYCFVLLQVAANPGHAEAQARRQPSLFNSQRLSLDGKAEKPCSRQQRSGRLPVPRGLNRKLA